MKKLELNSIEDTQKLAKEVASKLKGGEIIALEGDLGAGKTTFTQYLAQELGVKIHVNSPTFVIMKQYDTDKHPLTKLVHLDAYRLSSDEELADLGLDQHINATHSVVVIEWADKIKKHLDTKENVQWIKFELEGDIRKVTITT